ncbi:MAG TPA: hypothetical protein DEQ98_03405, partial [Acidobacteria bacterium]|nr:hypothetical protein [Acidobacteriota bacterium]
MSNHTSTLLGRALILLLLVVVGAVVAARTIGVRLEVDGSGIRPMLSRFNEDAHFDALESDRTERGPSAPTT